VKVAVEVFAAVLLALVALVMVTLPQIRSSSGSKQQEIERLREANFFLQHDYRTATDSQAELYMECERLRKLLRDAGIDPTPPPVAP
jgi:ABC-type siderophore export system fused ATPase/permease subunit